MFVEHVINSLKKEKVIIFMMKKSQIMKFNIIKLSLLFIGWLLLTSSTGCLVCVNCK